MASDARKITVVGLGIIGGTVARHLVNAGWNVGGYDLSDKANVAAASHDIEILETPERVANYSEIILTSLPSASAVTAVLQRIVDHAAKPLILVELSTLALPDKYALNELVKGSACTILDCPISGTGAQAADRDIAIYASGDIAALDRVEPAFDAFAKRSIRLGEYGQGTKMKLVANLLVAIHNMAAAEAMALATAAGLDPDAVIAAVEAGAGNSRIFELRAPMMAARSYEPATMKLGVWDKDLEAIKTFSDHVGSPTPLLDATRPCYAAATRMSAEWDTAAVFEALRGSIKHNKGVSGNGEQNG